MVAEAADHGAQVDELTSAPGEGYFVPPTLLTGVQTSNPVLKREVFGPVVPVVVIGDEDEAVYLANDTEVGLAGYVFGTLSSALRVAEQLEVGMVGVNRGLLSDAAAPFGGVKHSGLGREGGHEGLAEYQDTSYLSVDW